MRLLPFPTEWAFEWDTPLSHLRRREEMLPAHLQWLRTANDAKPVRELFVACRFAAVVESVRARAIKADFPDAELEYSDGTRALLEITEILAPGRQPGNERFEDRYITVEDPDVLDASKRFFEIETPNRVRRKDEKAHAHGMNGIDLLIHQNTAAFPEDEIFQAIIHMVYAQPPKHLRSVWSVSGMWVRELWNGDKAPNNLATFPVPA